MPDAPHSATLQQIKGLIDTNPPLAKTLLDLVQLGEDIEQDSARSIISMEADLIEQLLNIVATLSGTLNDVAKHLGVEPTVEAMDTILVEAQTVVHSAREFAKRKDD